MPTYLPPQAALALIRTIIEEVGPAKTYATVDDLIREMERLQTGCAGYIHGAPLPSVTLWLKELRRKFLPPDLPSVLKALDKLDKDGIGV